MTALTNPPRSAVKRLTLKRLTFVQLLYQQGLEQSELPEPLQFVAVLAFHRAAELFLILVGEHLGVELSGEATFTHYWTALSPAVLPGGVDLAARAGMERLDRMCADFKQTGAQPDAAAVGRARADVTYFFEDNTPLIFGIDFHQLTLTDLVLQPEARDHITRAETHADSGDYTNALAELNQAFQATLTHHAQRTRIDWRGGPYSFGNDSRRTRPSGADPAALELLHGLQENVEHIQQAMKVITTGIDYQRYARFMRIVPRVVATSDGARHIRPRLDRPVTHGEYRYCHHFVITSALHLLEADPDELQQDTP